MFQFLIKHFFSKENAMDLLAEHEEKIKKVSSEHRLVGSLISKGFKLWGMWRILVFCWWGFLILLCFLGAYIAYKFLLAFI